ncbi:MAG TPA: energy transducer TonB [Candidatus Angelobacter sp.]
MFAQKLGSSADNAWRKLESMTTSFLLHVFIAGLLLLPTVLVARVSVSGLADSPQPPVVVGTLIYSARPGDPSSRQHQPNTFHIPRHQIISVRSNVPSRINVAQPEAIVSHNEVFVLSDVQSPIPKLDIGYHGGGRCGCRPGPRPTPSPAIIPFTGQQSWMREPELLRRVDPEYPSRARQAGIQGAVVVRAIIDRDGEVTKVMVVGGPQQLRAAATDAIREWRYKPYILDGISVPVETTITVNFVLPGTKQSTSRMM